MDVLIAEDDDDIRSLVGTILRMAGYHTEAYGTGRSALVAARDRPPAVYVLDVEMPDGSGLELCRDLRSDPATRDGRILLMSAAASDDSLSDGLAAGADDYLPKPFTRKELLRRVATLIDEPVPRCA
jgi:DNA-binding response OmpR family regulator